MNHAGIGEDEQRQHCTNTACKVGQLYTTIGVGSLLREINNKRISDIYISVTELCLNQDMSRNQPFVCLKQN